MTPYIQLRCPGCSARIKAPCQLIGQTRSCPRCRHELNIELTPPQDAGPLLAADEARRPSRRKFSDAFRT